MVSVTRPHVVLSDLRFPTDPSGPSLLAAYRQAHPEARVVVFTDNEADSHILQVLLAGASGLLSKETPPQVLLHAIHLTAAGGTCIHTRGGISFLRSLRWLEWCAPPPGPSPRLSTREQEYLRMLLAGFTDVEIAHHVGLSRATVKTQLRRLYQKLRARNRAHAVARASALAAAAPDAAGLETLLSDAGGPAVGDSERQQARPDKGRL